MRNNRTKSSCSYGRHFRRNGAPGEKKEMRALANDLKFPQETWYKSNVHAVINTGIGKRIVHS